MRLYVASAITHVVSWRNLRREYKAIDWNSSWLDEVGSGSLIEDAAVSPERFSRCWEQNVKDVLTSDVLLLYHKENDFLRGSFVEAGIALGANIPISIVSNKIEQLSSWRHHPNVKVESSVKSFLDRLCQ